MAEVVVVALFKTNEGRGEEAATALLDTAAQTHEEEGCLLYAVHRSSEDPTQFVLIERWRSREDLDEHFTKPYVAALGERAAELLDGAPQIQVMVALPGGDPAKGSLAGT